MYAYARLNKCSVIALGTTICVLAIALSAPRAQAQSYNLFHLDEPVPLKLNSGRVAVFAGSHDPAAVESLAIQGMTVTNVDHFPIPGWQLLDVELNDVDGTALEDTLDRVARKGPFEFVAPVFFDDLGGPLIPTRDILVRFNPNIGRAGQDQILAAANVGMVLDRDWANMPGAYRIRSHSHNGLVVLEQANALARRPEVSWAEPDMIFTGRGAFIPNDTFFSSCWGLHNTGQIGGCQFGPGTADMDMDAPEAWDITTGDPGIMVLIMDTGVQQNHPDLNQIAGEDFTGQGGGGGPVNACEVHGTAVAGCVSSRINNNIGTVGVAPECRAVSARIFVANVPCDGLWTAQFSWGADALAWAEAMGVRVTNNSNFYGGSSAALADKYNQTRNNGMIHFASAGNNGSTNISYPASLSTVNAVAALNDNGVLASFSNHGPGLAFSAPGVDVATTDRTGSDGYINGDYVCRDGTSYAAPYAAGVAALVLSVDSSLDAFDVEQIMQDSSIDLGATGYDTTFGWGFVNARQAILGALKENTTTPFGFQAFRGFHVSGSLDDLLASDDSDLSYNPVIVPDPNEAPITLDLFGILPSDSPSTLAVTIESSANTVGLELTISFWNFNTNSWDVVGTATQSLNTDTVRTFAGTPADHVLAGTGLVLTRYEVRQVGLVLVYPWLDGVDHVFWTTTK